MLLHNIIKSYREGFSANISYITVYDAARNMDVKISVSRAKIIVFYMENGTIKRKTRTNGLICAFLLKMEKLME